MGQIIDNRINKGGPDFLVYSTNKIIGIELTRIFQDSTPRRINFQTSDSISNDILFRIRDLMIQKELIHFQINLSFFINEKMTKKKREIFAKKIFTIINKNIHRNDPHITIENDFEDLDNFPETVDSITIIRVTKLKQPFVTTSRYGLVQKDMIKLLTEAVNKKEKKISSYKKKSDEQWLLIHTDALGSGSFFSPSKESIEHKYISSFRKAFFLNSFDQEVFELKSLKN